MMKDFWSQPHKYDPVPAAQKELFESGALVRPRFEPMPLTQSSLMSSKTAIAAGEDGLKSEVVEAMTRMARRPSLDWCVDADLARKLCHGEVMKFSSDEERERVVRKAEMFAERIAEKISVRKGKEVAKQDVGFVPVDGELKESIVDKVVKGKYEFPSRPREIKGRDATIEQVEAALKMNGSYTPRKGRTVLDMVRSMWPAGRSTAARSASPANA